jgi:hypothetical protein
MARAYTPLPPAADLWDRFAYKPLTGELVFLAARGSKPKNATFGCPNTAGYVIGGYNGKLMYAHRLIYKWFTGMDPAPSMDIDHIDGNKSNNVFWNIRTATRTQNCFNRSAKGYVFTGGRYYARICLGSRKVVSLGGYATAAEAEAAYAAATHQYHGEFARPF